MGDLIVLIINKQPPPSGGQVNTHTTSSTPYSSLSSINIPGASAGISGKGAGSSGSTNISYSLSLSNFYSTSFLFLKLIPFTVPSFTAISLTGLMTASVTGISMNYLCVTFFPVASDRNLYLSCRFPTGSMQIAHFVLGSNVFLITGSTCTSQYDPNGALQCSLASSLCRDTNSCGLHFLDIPDFMGNKFIHIMQKWNNSITTNLVVSCRAKY